ncbi:hypothetical protein MMC30_003986 [Trapelia coarctata]|nr:hypothetical protein [Trapelia coarctata]
MEGKDGPVTGNLYIYLSHPLERSTILVGMLLESPIFGPQKGQIQVLYGGKAVEVKVQVYKTDDAVEFYFQIHDTDNYWTRVTHQQSRIEPRMSGPHYVDTQIVGRQVALENDYTVTVMVHAGYGMQPFSLLPLSQPFTAGDGVGYVLRVLDHAPFLDFRLGP